MDISFEQNGGEKSTILGANSRLENAKSSMRQEIMVDAAFNSSIYEIHTRSCRMGMRSATDVCIIRLRASVVVVVVFVVFSPSLLLSSSTRR